MTELETDTKFGHLWTKDERCNCGLISSSRDNQRKQFPGPEEATYESCEELPENLLKNLVILDHFESKLSAYCSAIEASESFSSVGKVIFI